MAERTLLRETLGLPGESDPVLIIKLGRIFTEHSQVEFDPALVKALPAALHFEPVSINTSNKDHEYVKEIYGS